VFHQSRAETGMVLDGVELSIEISSEGQISIVGSGGKLDVKGGIKLSFKRNPAKACMSSVARSEGFPGRLVAEAQQRHESKCQGGECGRHQD